MSAQTQGKPLALFQGTGIELEYVIVDRDTLDVRPICDKILVDKDGEAVLEAERGATRWSNELALHVVETKTNGPTADLPSYAAHFQRDITDINHILAEHNAMLMPTGMHPWMNPLTESRLWPHEQGEIYGQFDRVFNCKGHGWTNLQSMHINLPFADDDEFRRLHRAIRLLLPIMPSLAASSPMVGGEVTGQFNNRLRFYSHNCRRVPEVTGAVIPEDVADEAGYRENILRPMYQAMRQHDPKGILAHEWLNARGAIARFDRSAIEIRVLDTQEFPGADLLLARFLNEALKQVIDGTWGDLERTAGWDHNDLARIFQKVVTHGEHGWVDNEDYLGFFDFPGIRGSAGEIWQHILETGDFSDTETYSAFLTRDSLTTRIRYALGAAKPPREKTREVYRELCACLAEGRYFTP